MNPRRIPSIDVLLQQPAMRARVAQDGHAAVANALRRAADDWRTLQSTQDTSGGGADQPTAWIVAGALKALDATVAASLRPVLNATGVIIHTNLGRAPLAAAAMTAAADVACGYSNLEYDLDAGGRGHRHVHAEGSLCRLTGAEAAVITNNNAAATWLVLAALAAGREVIVSRGELVEIGGGFRVPEIMAQSGAVLREVGTTNRTRLSDYAAAIGDRTAMLLRVHPSNFRIEGFTERPSLTDLTALAHRFDLPVFEDLGSGWLGLPHSGGWPKALADEPSVADSVRAGVDVVSFSGDKLLGGPQAGIVAGRRPLLDQARRHPLMRAVRADKQTYAALEATLALWQREPARAEIPVVRMLLEPAEAIGRRAEAMAGRIRQMRSEAAPGSQTPICTVVDGSSTIGGGSAPQSAIPTRLLSIQPTDRTATQVEAALRTGTPSVVARIQHDAVLLDLRTIAPVDDARLETALGQSLGLA